MKTTMCLEAADVGAGATTDDAGRPAVGLGMRGPALDEPVGIRLSRQRTLWLIGRLSRLALELWPEGFEDGGGGL